MVVETRPGDKARCMDCEWSGSTDELRPETHWHRDTFIIVFSCPKCGSEDVHYGKSPPQ